MYTSIRSACFCVGKEMVCLKDASLHLPTPGVSIIESVALTVRIERYTVAGRCFS